MGYRVLLDELVERGTKIDAIGFQAHLTESAPSLTDMDRVFSLFEPAGIPIHITEFCPAARPDARVQSQVDNSYLTEEYQAERARRYYTYWFGTPEVEAITYWDFSDAGWSIWQEGSEIMTGDGRLKPIYYTLKELIHNEWHTELELQIPADGKVEFRGFLGNYTITTESSQFTVDLPTTDGISLQLV